VTLHKSLRGGSTMVRQRNVYNRWERLQKLKEAGRFTEGQSIFGLPKVRTVVVKVGGAKKKKAKAAEGAEGAEAAAAPGAAPAAAAAPAKKAEGAKKK
jgi:small basic protein (TIGR04137 family)